MAKTAAGVGIMFLRNNKILLGLRNKDPKKASSELKGEGTWTFPGGKIDFGESIFEAGQRECLEEIGVEVSKFKLFCINNNIAGQAQFLTFGLKALKYQGEVQTKEPEEITEWKWFSLSRLPKNLYFPTAKMIKMYKDKKLVDLEEK